MGKVPIGTYGWWIFRRPFLLLPAELRTHSHIIGISGSGKSRFLAGLYLAMLKEGLPCTLVDPHGDLAYLILTHLVEQGYFRDPKHFDQLLYLDLPRAHRQDRYLPFNVLAAHGSPYTIASNVMEAMHRAWPALGQGAAPMFDLLVQNGVKALCSANEPLTRLCDFLLKPDYRAQVLAKEEDADVRDIFQGWYDRLPQKDRDDQAGSTIRRVNLLTFDPVLKYSLGQQGNVLDFRRRMDRGQSAIINLAIENPEARRLLGCLLTVAAEQGALSRAELPPDQRSQSHHLMIDEFSEFVAQSGEALSRMLSQTRKYGLYLVMAHQTVSQLGERLEGASQNVGLNVVFRLGRTDAKYYATLLGKVEPRSVSVTEEEERISVGMSEQWETWVQHITDLAPRTAFVRRHGSVAHIETLEVDNVKPSDELKAVEDYFLRTYFNSRESIEPSPGEREQPQRSRSRPVDQ